MQISNALMGSLGYVGRSLPAIRGKGHIATALTSLLLKAGAFPILEGEMAAGHRLRLDCRVPSHCWAFFSGKYDEATRSALLSFLLPGGTALDVGANIGFYTVPMAAFAAKIGASVVAFEPVATYMRRLRYNLALNGCANVTVYETALGDQCGEVEIVLAEDFLAGGTVGNATIADPGVYGPQFSRTTVRLETLDNLWMQGRIDVIKLDIEGHEAKFLAGGANTIAVHRPVILLEVNRWHYEKQRVDFDAAIPALLPDKYIFAELRAGRIVQINSLAQCSEADVLLIPEERMR